MPTLPAAILSALILAITLVIVFYFLNRWRLKTQLASQSLIAQTSIGAVEYVDIGQGPVVFHAHGMLGGIDHARFCEFLVGAGFRVIVPSRPGYLRTPLAVGKTPLEQAALYAALLDRLGIDQAAFYVVSQGGASALEFALSYPERCSALILVSAFTQAQRSSEFQRIMPYVRAVFSADFLMWLFKPILVAVIMNQARKALSPSDQHDVMKMADLEYFFSAACQASLRGPGFVNDFWNLFHWSGVPLDQLKVPTLLIHGTNDVFVKCEDSARSASEIAGARFLSLPGVGHEAFITRVDQIERQMLPLLGTQAATRQGLA